MHTWYKSYLIGRRQCVTIDNHRSEHLTVKYGVKRGSILCPLFFCLYINDIDNLKCHYNSKISLYADDTVILNNFSEIQENLHNDSDLVCI